MIDHLPLEAYPCTRAISLIFADIDTIGHVNNVAIARFFEEGRVAAGRMIGELLSEPMPLRMVLAHVEIDYLAEVMYPGEVQVGTGVHRVGRTSIEFRAGLFQHGRPVAVSRSVDVNTIEGRPGSAPLSERYRTAAEKLLLPLG
ncbi:acyl-CoA thioesterase [Nocardia nova]|uniref:Acyl-CoA thioesterase n=1 Tax=Nocardia nova TaxID=37330 RepID=A0A2S6AQ43_9NOCA|nr:acyl-CoA thioesterase [Nocardia nova]PPJ26597.1 acyl-CoA thioesterase [Nocardia nova]PPJ37397.1 acyl-CoA thioesterase [Nocardia nova]